MTTGRTLHFDAIYTALGLRIRSELAEQLSARHDDDGALLVDAHQQTSVPGLFAAGDVVSSLTQISVAMGHAAVAATAIITTVCLFRHRQGECTLLLDS